MPVWLVRLEPCRDRCGTTPGEFGRLLEALAPLVVVDRAERAAWPGRKRAPGAGRPGHPFWVRLVVALTHAWQGTSVRKTAANCGVHERSVRRYRDELERLLLRAGLQARWPDGHRGPVRTTGELAGWLRATAEADPQAFVIVDGTEIRRARPGGWAAQRPAYSSKSHQHAVKATVVATSEGEPVWFAANPTGEGRTHDITMLRRQHGLLDALRDAEIAVVADLGYEGLHHDLGDRAWAPKRRPPRQGGQPAGRLSRDEKIYNHALAQARIRVEHAIRYAKRWGALQRWRRDPDKLDATGQALVNLCSILAG